MLMMNGMGGLGNLGVTCSPPFVYHPESNSCDCATGTTYNSSLDTCERPSTNSTPWWQSLVTGITQGAAAGVSQPKPPTMPTPMPVAPTPWYTTPMGMAGIIGGALVLFLVMKK